MKPLALDDRDVKGEGKLKEKGKWQADVFPVSPFGDPPELRHCSRARSEEFIRQKRTSPFLFIFVNHVIVHPRSYKSNCSWVVLIK